MLQTRTSQLVPESFTRRVPTCILYLVVQRSWFQGSARWGQDSSSYMSNLPDRLKGKDDYGTVSSGSVKTVLVASMGGVICCRITSEWWISAEPGYKLFLKFITSRNVPATST